MHARDSTRACLTAIYLENHPFFLGGLDQKRLRCHFTFSNDINSSAPVLQRTGSCFV